MNDTPAGPPIVSETTAHTLASPAELTVAEIFGAFLMIGATSFGGGVVAYLRDSLVAKHRWLDDKTFVELLSISQTLPGLNATNMAVLVGDRLRGSLARWGAYPLTVERAQLCFIAIAAKVLEEPLPPYVASACRVRCSCTR